MDVSRSVYLLETYPNEARQDVVSFPLHIPISAEESRLLFLGRFACPVIFFPRVNFLSSVQYTAWYPGLY